MPDEKLIEKLTPFVDRPVYLDATERILLLLDGGVVQAVHFSAGEWKVFLLLLTDYPEHVAYSSFLAALNQNAAIGEDRQKLRDLVYALRPKVRKFHMRILSLHGEGYCLVREG